MLKELVLAPEPFHDSTLQSTKYEAAMVLAGVGDALGYNNGAWEFCKQGVEIHRQVAELGGIAQIKISGRFVSDDQVMHLATADALIEYFNLETKSISDLYPLFAKHYLASFADMRGRSPGPTTAISIGMLDGGAKWDQIPFNRRGGGCGGAMRSMCIGLIFYGEAQRVFLIASAIESGRITHNHPTGIFGSLASAVFMAFAIEGVPLASWGRKLVTEILPRAYKFLESDGRNWTDYQKDLKFFEIKWRTYLENRSLLNADQNEPIFPDQYGVEERDKFYAHLSYDGWGGASGHDAPMIAYDALLGCEGDWLELVARGVLHGGDNDSTGCIAAAWYGALYGYQEVPQNNYRFVEYGDRAKAIAAKLYEIQEQMPH